MLSAYIECTVSSMFGTNHRQALTTIAYLHAQAAVGEEGSLPMSADPDPIKILTTDAEVAGWNSDGLPNDQVYI